MLIIVLSNKIINRLVYVFYVNNNNKIIDLLDDSIVNDCKKWKIFQFRFQPQSQFQPQLEQFQIFLYSISIHNIIINLTKL